MSLEVSDFKNLSGIWVRSFVNDGIQYHTQAGNLWDNLCKRTKEGGSIQLRFPSYIGCVNRFENFNAFCEWCQNQIGYKQNFHLDKDLVGNGKEYSEEFCVFVPRDINNFLTNSKKSRGDYPVGVNVDKYGYIRAEISLGSVRKYLGTFDSIEAAFSRYKTAKEDYAKYLADKWKSQIDPRTYKALTNFSVNIED